MKLYIIILLSILFHSCFKDKEQTSNAIKTIIITETKKEKQNSYVNIFYKTAHSSKNLDNYINNIKLKVAYLYDVKYDPKTKTLNYFVLENKEFPSKDFYALSKILEFDWTYFIYNDIYKASFMYKEVKRVSVYDYSNKKYLTFLPAKSDILYMIKGNIFDSDIYIDDLDYNSLNLKCNSSESKSCTVTKINIQKELITTK